MSDEYNKFSKYISLTRKIDSFLELYVYIREYISSMDEYMRNARADEVMKLIGIYKNFMRTVKASNDRIQYSGMNNYISRTLNMDICRNVVRFIDLRNEVADSLLEIDDDINSIENKMMAEQLRMKYMKYENDFKEYTQKCDAHGLEVLKNRVDRFIEDYSRELSGVLYKTVTLKIKGDYEYELVLLIRMIGEELRCEILDKADYSDEVEEEIEYMGRSIRSS